jgi:pyruvate dehydrogenase E1 component alpha subunit
VAAPDRAAWFTASVGHPLGRMIGLRDAIHVDRGRIAGRLRPTAVPAGGAEHAHADSIAPGTGGALIRILASGPWHGSCNFLRETAGHARRHGAARCSMPRDVVEPDRQVETLSILDPDGQVDEELMPQLDDEQLLGMHRAMLLSRRFDQRLMTLQRQGRIGTFAPIEGQEASQVGAAAALDDEDWLVPSFRETAAALCRGASPLGILLYNAGYNEGGHVPEGQNDLPISIPVGTQLPFAVGMAYALKLRQEEQVVLSFFGDGATSEGDFHEALNFAAVFETPSILVCQNNQWAISVPRKHQTRSSTLAEKALAYNMPGIQADGNDVLAVYVATSEAVKRARSGDGPSLIECVTYRLGVHTTADDPSRYRTDQEVESWRERDPLDRFQKLLRRRELLSDEAIEQLEAEIKQKLESAWEEAKQQMDALGDPLEMFEHVFAELPAYLLEQRDELAGERGERKSEDGQDG